MSGHSWGRTQKYKNRPRQLYALLFDNGCAYIGQTVNMRTREQQHRRRSGGWEGKAFRCVHLGLVNGTEEQAKDHEHAWRHKAAKNGWKIYAKPPGVIVNHRRQMNLKRYFLAWTLRWPSRHSRNLEWRVLRITLVVVALVWWLFL